MTMRGISRTFAEVLEDSTEFKALTNSLTSEEFNYYINVDLSSLKEVLLPYFAIVTFNDEDDKEVKKAFKTQFLIGVARDKPATVGKITEEPTLDKLETLTREAVAIISKQLRDFGMNGDSNVRISYVNMYVPAPDGEDDLQMQVDIEIEQDKLLCK